MSTIGPHLLGRNKEHDPRSRAYASPRRVPVTFRSAAHTLGAPPLDQADVGSCEGNTAAEFLNCAMALPSRRAYNRADPAHRGFTSSYLDEKDALRLYSAATNLDDDPAHYPPTDTGTSGLGVAKAMVQDKAIETYNWTFTMNDFLANLMHQPIMLGTNWYDSMMDVDSKGFVSPPPARAQAAGGHAYLAFVLDWSNRAVGCTNHWVMEDGTPWGVTINRHKGCFWITTAFLGHLLLNEEGESLVPVILPK
jgi:hypothetical protein